MKTLLILFTFLFITTSTFSQICGPSTDVKYEQISKTKLKAVITNKCDKEIGYLKITAEGKLIRHGIWKSYCKGHLKMKAMYDYGKLVWIKTDVQPKITYNEIVYLRNEKYNNTRLAGNDRDDD